jgi:hypothetical protein
MTTAPAPPLVHRNKCINTPPTLSEALLIVSATVHLPHLFPLQVSGLYVCLLVPERPLQLSLADAMQADAGQLSQDGVQRPASRQAGEKVRQAGKGRQGIREGRKQA